MNQLKNLLSSGNSERNRQATKGGSYSLAVTAVVLAILVVVNIFVSALPTHLTRYDISSSQLYSITSNTKAVVNALEQDVSIYWIVQSGAEDPVIENLLGKYQSLSDHIAVAKKNPDVYPAFAEQYTDEVVQNNSLVVECGDKHRYIGIDDIYLGEINIYSGTYNASDFDGEGAITSAIDYVTSEEYPQVYILEGHGEAELPASFAEQIEKENEQLKNGPGFSVPPELDKRCMASIKKACRRRRSGQLGRKAYGVLSKVAVVVLVVLVLFTSAYAAFPNVRASTLNLLVQISDVSAEMIFENANAESSENGDSNGLISDGTIELNSVILPELITDKYQVADMGSDRLSSWASFSSQDGGLISIDVRNGADSVLDINTENALQINEIKRDDFSGIIVFFDGGYITAGIADQANGKFIILNFDGISYDSAELIIDELINVNMEGQK